MGEEKIDAFNYASNEYGVASALKDGVKDKLKGEMTKEELLNKLQEIQKENVNQQLWN